MESSISIGHGDPAADRLHALHPAEQIDVHVDGVDAERGHAAGRALGTAFAPFTGIARHIGREITLNLDHVTQFATIDHLFQLDRVR